MREIKFRGRIADGKWEVGSLVRGSNDKKVYIFTLDEIEQWTVDPETVGQYTGLKDKNDTEIYEGDIVEQTYHVPYGNPHEGTEGSYDGHHTGEVVITTRGVCLRNPLHYSMDNDETKLVKAYKQLAGYRSEVIGNMMEHPHLLEGRDEA